MRLLLDTHILLWAAGWPTSGGQRSPLSDDAIALIGAPENQPMFSVVSLWEVAIKTGLGRADFKVDPHELRRGLLANAYDELPILGEHALAVTGLPPLHGDPFDRLLIAQTITEGVLLLTADAAVARYSGPIRLV